MKCNFELLTVDPAIEFQDLRENNFLLMITYSPVTGTKHDKKPDSYWVLFYSLIYATRMTMIVYKLVSFQKLKTIYYNLVLILWKSGLRLKTFFQRSKVFQLICVLFWCAESKYNIRFLWSSHVFEIMTSARFDPDSLLAVWHGY